MQIVESKKTTIYFCEHTFLRGKSYPYSIVTQPCEKDHATASKLSPVAKRQALTTPTNEVYVIL